MFKIPKTWLFWFIALVVTGVVILTLLENFVFVKDISKPQSSKPDFALNSLIVDFNEQENAGIFADVHQEEFVTYLTEELANMSAQYKNINETYIKYIYSTGNSINIRWTFINDNLTNKEKLDILEDIKSQLENKWYIQKTHPDNIETINYDISVHGN